MKLLIFYNNIAKVSNIRKNIISVHDVEWLPFTLL